jgi:hypothetical protein
MVNIDKNQLAAHYGEAWDDILPMLEGLSRVHFWEFLRLSNLQPIIEGMQTDSNASALAQDILERRIENRVLLILEHTFAPETTNVRT